MKPVNKKVAIISNLLISASRDSAEGFLNWFIQSEYDKGWQLRYTKPMDDGFFLLFTHAEFDEVPDGDDE